MSSLAPENALARSAPGRRGANAPGAGRNGARSRSPSEPDLDDVVAGRPDPSGSRRGCGVGPAATARPLRGRRLPLPGKSFAQAGRPRRGLPGVRRPADPRRPRGVAPGADYSGPCCTPPDDAPDRTVVTLRALRRLLVAVRSGWLSQ